MSRYISSLCWFRRDLRSEDHAALHAALTASERVFCAFVFDTEILDKLPGRRDRRVEFIRESVAELQRALQALGGGLEIAHGPARSELPRLAAGLGVEAVFANHDYDPAAIARDKDVAAALASAGIAWLTRKDHVVFEGDEILSGAGRPYTVFTPYKNAWLKKLEPFFLKSYPIGKYRTRLAPARSRRMPSLGDIGFERTNLSDLDITAGMSGARRLFTGFRRRMDHYHERRDFPALAGCDDRHIHAPWRMTPGEQQKAGLLIGRDYPAPIVDHNLQRKRALELYRRAKRRRQAEAPDGS